MSLSFLSYLVLLKNIREQWLLATAFKSFLSSSLRLNLFALSRNVTVNQSQLCSVYFQFIIEDMKQQQTNKHSNLHREDQHITVEELWKGWKTSEGMRQRKGECPESGAITHSPVNLKMLMMRADVSSGADTRHWALQPLKFGICAFRAKRWMASDSSKLCLFPI